MGSLIFFFQFLEAGGRWEELIKFIPLTYSSNNASEPKDVIGTILLSVLNGHWRYAHINSLRDDGVNPGLLGTGHTVSEDVVRRALKKMDDTATPSTFGSISAGIDSVPSAFTSRCQNVPTSSGEYVLSRLIIRTGCVIWVKLSIGAPPTRFVGESAAANSGHATSRPDSSRSNSSYSRSQITGAAC